MYNLLKMEMKKKPLNGSRSVEEEPRAFYYCYPHSWIKNWAKLFNTHSHSLLWLGSSLSFPPICINAYYWIDKYALRDAFLASLSHIFLSVFSATLLILVHTCDLEDSARGGSMVREEKFRTTWWENSAQFLRFSLLLATLTMPKHDQ